MANWILATDFDDQRRRAFVRDLEQEISPVDGLIVGSAGGDGWNAVWAASPAAPVDADVDEAGGAVVWGTALDELGNSQSAADIRAAWKDCAVGQWDGYYSAAVVDVRRRSLLVAADLLGIFPVYYWSGPDGVTIVGSSPELFRCHPLFTPRLDIDGLLGILLTNGLVDNRPLLAEVRRLGQGFRLKMQDAHLVEETSYEIPEVEDDDRPFVAHIDRLFTTLSDAVERHTAADSSYTMLLSGGLDSRMVAGFMHRLDRSPTALTLGLGGDLEMRCAKSVARQYGLKHATDEPDADNYPAVCRLTAKWEHLSNGFTNVRDWWTQGRLGSLGDRVVTGLLSDSLVGGSSVEWAYDQETHDLSYETFVEQMPKLGLPRDVLGKLLSAATHVEQIDGVLQRLREEFEDYGGDLAHSAWRYDLAHGQRYHVGSIAWRMSFGAWPVIPMLDRRVIETAAGMPAASMADRDLQRAMIVDKMPELAALPLDRSDRYLEEPEYLAPEARQLAAAMLRRLTRPLNQMRRRIFSSENRYWFRINNFNGDQWKSARRAAEGSRERMEHLFDPDYLRLILPPPDEAAALDGPYVGEAARKMLLGFAYWADSYVNDNCRSTN